MIRPQLLRGLTSTLRKRAHPSFSISVRHNSYEDTISNLRIGKHTRVIFQGFTGQIPRTPILPVAVNSGVRKTSVSIIIVSLTR